jgi:anionic cell wall polymer biosynthesis LytR-Cps2A-Psr (LCP) family protein
MQTIWRERQSSGAEVRAQRRAIGSADGREPVRISVRCGRFCCRHRVAIAILAVPAVLFVASGLFAATCWLRVERVSVSFPGSAPGGTTYLLVGNDSRAFVQSASDRSTFGTLATFPGQHANVVVLVRVRSDGPPEVLSLPRDLLVRLPDGAPVRLTQSFDPGAQTLVDTVCHSLGIGVSHLVIIQMNGLRSLVDDALGPSP